MARKTKAQIKAEEEQARELAALHWHNNGDGWRRKWRGWSLELRQTNKSYSRDMRWWCRLDKGRNVVATLHFDDVATMDESAAKAKADQWLASCSLQLARELMDLAFFPTFPSEL